MRDVALTFAGGGNRAFYQLGLMNRWGARLLPRVSAVVSCSAGACIATTVLAGRTDAALRYWKDRRRGVTKNFEWRRLLRGQRPTPHAPIYRDTMVFAMRDGGLERLRSMPFPVWVLAATSPRGVPIALSIAAGLGAYNLEKKLRPERIHPTLTRRLGFRAALFDARECRSPEEVADLVLASSATPPFTPLGRYRGRRFIDGGLVDNAPAWVADEMSDVKKNVVLLTRPHPRAAAHSTDRRMYVAPTRPVPVDRWDYTRPERIDATIEQGERESEEHEAALSRFVGISPSGRGGG